MNAFDEIRQSIAPELQQLNERMRAALATSNPLMSKVIDGYLKSKGKLIRPIMVILTARLFGTTGERTIAAAAAVEMLHNASLIHDDVVDESKTRRGRDTINSIWDNHIAVLVGDYFVSTALQQALLTADIRIVNSLSMLGRTLSLGEIDQIYNARYHCLDGQAYFDIISHKTASLFVSCVEMGAYSVDAGEGPRLDAIRRYAELLGLCFQIRDDIFDYYSDEAVGKPTGNDLREGKITLPLLYALNNKEAGGRDGMIELSHSEMLSESQIATLIEFAKANGGIEYAYETMRRLRDEAVTELDKTGSTEQTAPLRDLFDFIIERRV